MVIGRSARLHFAALAALSLQSVALAAPVNFAPAPLVRPSLGPPPDIGKCVNLSNMLEAPNEGDWGRAFRDDDASTIRSAGFKTVRLPVNFAGHAVKKAPYTIDPRFMARVRHVIDVNRAAGLNVILDQHNNGDFSSDPVANQERLAGLWRQIAEQLRDEPPSLWFEILNEPHGKLTNANLIATFTPSLAAIRATNPTRIVVIGGENWSGIASLAHLDLPNDPYVIPTIHYYEPFEFTHQGARFIKKPPPLGRVFGGSTDIAQLQANLAKIKAYETRTGRAPFVGEYGAIDIIPSEQRALYYGTVSSAFASIGIPACAWGYTNTFRLRTDNGWMPGLVEAIKAPR